MIIYIDTSAPVKRYVAEPGSDDVNQLIDQAENTGSIVLTNVEMASALSKAVRLNRVDIDQATNAWGDFLTHWEAFIRLSIYPALIDRSASLTWGYQLRAYDALHIAAALSWQEVLETPITLATYDEDMWKAAKELDIDVFPEMLVD